MGSNGVEHSLEESGEGIIGSGKEVIADLLQLGGSDESGAFQDAGSSMEQEDGKIGSERSSSVLEISRSEESNVHSSARKSKQRVSQALAFTIMQCFAWLSNSRKNVENYTR